MNSFGTLETIKIGNETFSYHSLAKLEKYELAVFADSKPNAGTLEAAVGRAQAGKSAAQLSLFAIANEQVITELRNSDINSMGDVEAKKLLLKLQNRIV